VKLRDLNVENLPKSIGEHMKLFGGKLRYTELTWRNLYMDPIFASFIARLFQDSFRTGVSKQNFRLTTDKKKLTLIKIMDKFIGRQTWEETLKGGRFDIFNSSSFSSNLLVQLNRT
jgi:hypothetical protein